MNLRYGRDRDEKETREYVLFCEKCGSKRSFLNDGTNGFWCPRHPDVELILLPKRRRGE